MAARCSCSDDLDPLFLKSAIVLKVNGKILLILTLSDKPIRTHDREPDHNRSTSEV